MKRSYSPIRPLHVAIAAELAARTHRCPVR